MTRVNIFNILLMLFSLIVPVILNQKHSRDADKFKLKKLNDCSRCKVLTDSFNTWFHKTSRGKHEGGDAAWEETKLKSYARSEMRLVEIQESLCSELERYKDQCYSLSEDTEHLIEKWWFHEYNNNLDLYTWLCVENLHYCCPVDHYGEFCTPCPRDKNNKICGGNGKCDGSGTRKGNGTCICKPGFSGKHCADCSKNFFKTNSLCVPCHKACDECTGEGKNSCTKCAPGWIMKSGVCLDNNECLNSNVCKEDEFCVNSEGSYQCTSCDPSCGTCVGSGSSSCSSCTSNNILLLGKCIESNNLKDIIIRLGLYLCLTVFIFLFVYKKSKYFASFTMLTISLLIYYFEKHVDTSMLDFFI